MCNINLIKCSLIVISLINIIHVAHSTEIKNNAKLLYSEQEIGEFFFCKSFLICFFFFVVLIPVNHKHLHVPINLHEN